MSERILVDFTQQTPNPEEGLETCPKCNQTAFAVSGTPYAYTLYVHTAMMLRRPTEGSQIPMDTFEDVITAHRVSYGEAQILRGEG